MDSIVCIVELDKCNKVHVKGPHVWHILFNAWCNNSKIALRVWGLPNITCEADLFLNILALLHYIGSVVHKSMCTYQ